MKNFSRYTWKAPGEEILELKIISQGSEKLTGWFSQMDKKEEANKRENKSIEIQSGKTPVKIF